MIRAFVLDELLSLVPFEEVDAPAVAVRAAMRYTEAKDAPIVAAAAVAQVDYLVTLDKVHLVDVPQVTEMSGIKVVLPRTLLEALRAGN